VRIQLSLVLPGRLGRKAYKELLGRQDLRDRRAFKVPQGRLVVKVLREVLA
jgi:hypothetical protein